MSYLKESFFDKIVYFMTLLILKTLCLILRSTGHKIEFRNTKKYLKETRPVILACTHEIWCDIPLSSLIAKKKLRYIAKTELFQGTGLASWWLARVKAIPLNRDKPSLVTIKRAIEVLKNGHWLVVFPEGTRITEKNFSCIEKGTAVIALASKLDAIIIPTALVYSKNKSIISFPKKTLIECGDPIEIKNFTDKNSLTKELAEKMKLLYENSVSHL